jgi:hypothetical protein
MMSLGQVVGSVRAGRSGAETPYVLAVLATAEIATVSVESGTQSETSCAVPETRVCVFELTAGDLAAGYTIDGYGTRHVQEILTPYPGLAEALAATSAEGDGSGSTVAP